MLTHRLRLVLTGLAIALGVAFMSGSFVFSATLTRGLNSLFAQASMGNRRGGQAQLADRADDHGKPGAAAPGLGARDRTPGPRRRRRGRGDRRAGGAARPGWQAAARVVRRRAELAGGRPVPGGVLAA